MFKLDGMTGEVLWSQHYASGDGVDEAALGMALDSQDNVFVTGRAMIGTEVDQAMTMKLAADSGNIVWMETFGGSGSGKDVSWDIVVGSDDQPVISGFVVDAGDVASYFVRKLENSDGATVWDKRGPEVQNNFISQGTWLELMDNDDVVMCQRVFGSNGFDVFLKRFAANDGSMVWTHLYDGENHLADDPQAMVRDAEGNLLIAGVQDVSLNYDFMALKVDGNTGEPLWVSNYDGPPGWYDVASCVTSAADGSVIVSGLSDGIGTGWDWATVAFDGSDGSQLWEMRYNGPNNQSDEPSHLVASAEGEVFVTGYGYGVGTNQDQITVCYHTQTTSAVGDTPVAAGMVHAWPNPFNPRVNFSFEISGENHTRLAVFDLRGRQVTTLVDRILDEGNHSASWDGRDKTGRSVPAGVYLAILQSGETRSSQKIVLAK